MTWNINKCRSSEHALEFANTLLFVHFQTHFCQEHSGRPQDFAIGQSLPVPEVPSTHADA